MAKLTRVERMYETERCKLEYQTKRDKMNRRSVSQFQSIKSTNSKHLKVGQICLTIEEDDKSSIEIVEMKENTENFIQTDFVKFANKK